jgi:hypothetical protein
VVAFLVIGALAANIDEGSIGDEEGKLSVSITTRVDLYDSSGKKLQIISLPFIPQALVTPSGKEVSTMKVTLTWSASGSEINWTTLSISVVAYKSITPYYENPLVDNVKFVEETLSDKSGEYVISWDLLDAISPYAAQLEDGKEIYFTIKIVVKASAYDIYGIKRETASYIAKATAVLEWSEPSLSLEASTGGTYEILSIIQKGEVEGRRIDSMILVLVLVAGVILWINRNKLKF